MTSSPLVSSLNAEILKGTKGEKKFAFKTQQHIFSMQYQTYYLKSREVIFLNVDYELLQEKLIILGL